MASTDFGLWKDFLGILALAGEGEGLGGRWLLLLFSALSFFCLKWDIIPCLHMFDTC